MTDLRLLMGERVTEIDLAQELRDREVQASARPMFVLVRFHGHPLGVVRVLCPDGVLRAEALRTAIAADSGLSRRLRECALERRLMQHAGPASQPLPSWSVVVCTRDRPDDL